MILEALRRLSGSSVSRVSNSSAAQNGRKSKYGFSTRPPLTDLYSTDTEDEGSNEPHLLSAHDVVRNFKASHLVKFLGSGVVNHHTDFGGCQEVMDSIKLPSSRKRKKKKWKSNALIITFTATAMITTSADTQLKKHVCNLENIFVVHPHPTKDKCFSLISNHTSSGTLKCFCYMTLDNTTGTDVLLSFREACSIWIREKRRREGSDYEWIQRKEYRLDSTVEDGRSNSELLSETQSSSRRVSFAPTLSILHSDTPSDEAMEKFQDCLIEMESSPIFLLSTHSLSSSSNLHTNVSADESGEVRRVYFSRPQLPPKAYPPPAPPEISEQFVPEYLESDFIPEILESDSSFDTTLETQQQLKAMKTFGCCADFHELDEYDFIKEETMFRNFGRSFSAPCLTCYSEQPELFVKYSQVLYRHPDAYQHTECSSSSVEESDDEDDEVEHLENNISSSQSSVDESEAGMTSDDDGAGVREDTSSVALVQSGTCNSNESVATLTQEGNSRPRGSTTTLVLLQGKCSCEDTTGANGKGEIDNQVSLMSFSQSWMTSDASDEHIAPTPPFMSRLTDACFQMMSTLDLSTSSLLNIFMKRGSTTQDEDKGGSKATNSKLVFRDVSQLSNLAKYLLWHNTSAQGSTESVCKPSPPLEEKSNTLQLQRQALGQHNSSKTLLVLRSNEPSLSSQSESAEGSSTYSTNKEQLQQANVLGQCDSNNVAVVIENMESLCQCDCDSTSSEQDTHSHCSYSVVEEHEKQD